MVDVPTSTVTFLFTDIESSTTRWEQHQAAMQAALARHLRITMPSSGLSQCMGM